MPNSPIEICEPFFQIPTNNSGEGNVLKVGRGISVYWDVQPSNVWSEHRHSAVQIVIALDPIEAQMTWGKQHESKARCTMPHIWCVPHDTPHAAEWTGKAAMVVFYVDRELVREECHTELTKGLVLPLAPLAQQDYLLARLCGRFREHCHHRKSMSEPMIFAGAVMLSLTILRLCIRKGRIRMRSTLGLGEKKLETLAHFLEKHLREPLTPALLASVVGMGEDHFSRMLRHATGLPPMKYIWRCRLHRARLLLESGEWKVAQVAVECGFYDQSHLDRRFRKEFGCTPGFVIPPLRAGKT